MKFARGFFKGRVRSFVQVTPLGTLHIIETNGKRVGVGAGWDTAYMNMRANLPTVLDEKSGVRVTDWSVLDAQVSK